MLDCLSYAGTHPSFLFICFLFLGAALACPLLELVGACLAFLQIGQLSVTFQTKGRIKVGTEGQERKFEESLGCGRKGLHSLGQS